MGWNALREQIFANQKKLGVIPANTELTPWSRVLRSSIVVTFSCVGTVPLLARPYFLN